MQQKIILGTAGILTAMLLIWAFAFVEPYQLHGSEITSQIPAPAIDLTQADGTPFDMAEHSGRIVVLFFGYTSCPDVCPTTLADFKRVKEEIGDKASLVDFVFVTVDPQRDSPERTQAYASGFDASFIGLSGSETELEPVWQGYGVYRAISNSQHDAGYSVDHSTRTYLIDKFTHLRMTYPYGTPVQDLADDIRFLLKEK